MSDDKTAAEMLRELREGMTPEPWQKDIENTDEVSIYGANRDHWIALFPHQCVSSIEEQSHADARGIVALVNSLEEIAAVMEAAQRLEQEFVEFDNADGRTFDSLWDALEALTEKLREQLKGAGE